MGKLETLDTEKIAFEPTENDIVCTKLRTWNARHPGNMFFNQMIATKVPCINQDSDFRNFAAEIIDLITTKGGSFLKLNDKDCRDGGSHPKFCTVMNQKQCIHRVVRSLRTAHAKLHGTAPPRKPNKYRRKSKKQYEATAGDRFIHPHALQLISLVCNHVGQNAFRVLDKPIAEYTVDTEPEKERLMRLQIRQRYASAKAVNMPLLEFSKKLMQLWGGHVVERKTINDTKSGDSPTQSPTALNKNVTTQDSAAETKSNNESEGHKDCAVSTFRSKINNCNEKRTSNQEGNDQCLAVD